MNNKEKLKKIIAKDINPNDYYNDLVKKIKKKEINRIGKYILIPTCLLIFISGYLLIKSNITPNNNILLESSSYNFNNSSLKVVENNNDLMIPFPFKENANIIIPTDLVQSKTYIVFTKDNDIYSYILKYFNNDKSINVAYAKDYEPMKEYYYSEEVFKIKKINNIALKIYNDDINYYIEFNYNNYNFSITTTNINEKELNNFLKSILK